MFASSQTGVKSYVEIEPSPNPSASRAGIVFLIVAQGIYGWAIATNVWTYPSEVLSTRQRSTAMSLASLVTKLSCMFSPHSFVLYGVEGWRLIEAVFINLFLVPIALEKVSCSSASSNRLVVQPSSDDKAHGQIGWWTYLPFVLANPIFAAVFYFFAVETKGVNRE
jgi:hypothetical protein